ncbi:MAG: hypothetical protein IPL90_12915 [Holophagales bacterium]|nr:hypothetical protein [Holophagales bacterium]
MAAAERRGCELADGGDAARKGRRRAGSRVAYWLAARRRPVAPTSLRHLLLGVLLR